MSKIKIAELKETKSELSLLEDYDTDTIVGGYGNYDYSSHYRQVRNDVVNNIDVNVSTVVQVNNNVNVQLNFGGGDNINIADLNNNAGINQS